MKVFDGIGGNLGGNTVAFGSMTNEPEIVTSYTSDPKVLKQYEDHPKEDLNTPWYERATQGLESTIKKVLVIAAIAFLLYLLTLYLSRRSA